MPDTPAFVVLTHGALSGYRRADVPEASARRLLESLPAITAPDRCERVDGTGSRFSYRCTLDEPSRPLYLKVIRPRSALRRLVVDRLVGTLGEVASRNAIALERRGIPSPTVQLLMVARSGPEAGTCWIFTELAAPATFIEPFIHRGLDDEEPAPDVRSRGARIRAWALFVRRMHDAGAFHLDLSNYNVFVRRGRDGAPVFELVDLDMLVPLPEGSGLPGRLLRGLELVIMNAMFKDRDFARRDKLRFLMAYFGPADVRRILRGRVARLLLDSGEVGRKGWFRRPAFACCRLMALAGILDRPDLAEGEPAWLRAPAPSPPTP